MSARLSRVRKSDNYGAIEYHTGKTDVTSLFARVARNSGSFSLVFPDGTTACLVITSRMETTTFSEQGQQTQSVTSAAFFFEYRLHDLLILIPVEKVKVWI